MTEFTAAEPSEAEYTEVGEMAVDGPVTVEFIGFEALPQIQSAPEIGVASERHMMASPESATMEPAIASVTPITTYLESAPAIEVPASKLQFVAPDGFRAERPEPVEADDSPSPRPRRGTNAYTANKLELAA